MPQLDFLIFFNEMFYTLVAYIIFYIIFYRKVVVVLAYNLKLRTKLSNKIKNIQIKAIVAELFGIKPVFKNLGNLTKYLNYVENRERNLITTLQLAVRDFFMNQVNKIK
uniref:ATPase subunit 8 n=1 Tax=Dictyostelium citrinum TaxID=361072 RepID=Q2LCQ9_DICCI|nr:ATP synthase F0 subunit 8 [Dictyostelium citrinum]ABC60384.1 ATPase subunit 8 [Dictyostelium citrinum]